MSFSILKRSLLRSLYQLTTTSVGRHFFSKFRFDLESKKLLKRNDQPFQILIYHRVLPEFDPFAIDVTPHKRFEKQIKYLSTRFNIVSLDEMMQNVYQGEIKPDQLCITFDDGYFDNFKYAFPVLKRYNIPATIFLTTDFISNNRYLWFDKAIQFIKYCSKEKINLKEFLGPELHMADFKQKSVSMYQLLEWLKTKTPVKRDEILNFLYKKYIMSNIKFDRLMLNWEEIREMKKSGIEFGSHTKSHPILSKISVEQIKNELIGSKNMIEEKLDQEIHSFAYPNGKVDDFSVDSYKILAECGYTYAVTTIPGNNFFSTNPFMLHRFLPWDKDPKVFTGRVIFNRITN